MSDGLPTPRRHFAVLTIWLAIGMAVLDGGVVNTALPLIARQFGEDPGAAIWVLNAYQFAMIVALLPLAAAGDKLGYARVYRAGLLVFTLGSLACALSQSLTQLVAARLLQGLGAAGVLSVNTALVRFTYPRHLLGRGIGMNGVVVALTSVAGPAIASAILSTADWRWIFAINLPIGVVTLAIAAMVLPRPVGSGAKLDVPAVVLNVIAFSAVIFGLESLGRFGAVWPAALLFVGASAAVLLVRRSLARVAPLVPLDLVGLSSFRGPIALSIAAFSAQMLAFIALPFFLQNTLHRSVGQAGLLMSAWPLASTCAALVAGRLADRGHGRSCCCWGLALFSLGLALLAAAGPSPDLPHLIGWIALCGLGLGLFQSPNNRAIVLAAPPTRSGAAGGMLVMARLLGQVTGAMVMARLFHAPLARPTQLGFAMAAAIAATAAISLLPVTWSWWRKGRV